jgi:hypothetical protein
MQRLEVKSREWLEAPTEERIGERRWDMRRVAIVRAYNLQRSALARCCRAWQ